MAAKKKTAPEPTYSAAAEELDTILDGIESGSADVDELAARVERASELMRVCRDKLSATEVRVHKIIESLGDEPAPKSSSTEPPPVQATATDATPPWDEE